jgi:hypothetical protein
MKRQKNIILMYLLIFFSSCTKTNPGPVIEDSTGRYLKGKGVFIVNEGNFMAGNGSLSFYSYDSSRIYNNIFFSVNDRPLGDVPNSMVISGDKAYIVVNNSGKIEVADKNTLHSLKTISGLVSPRNILLINSSKAYVSSLYSKTLMILNLQSNTVSGNIDIRRSSEAMALTGEKAYVACWSSGKEIMVININTNKVLDSLEVAPEPESMAVDKNNKLWVLCPGSYTRQNFAELIIINTSTDKIEKRFVFPSKEMSPSCLQINMTKDTLYYIEGGVFRMSITSAFLPTQYFIPASGHLFYKLGIDPDNNNIFITDAVDYQQKGFVLRYSPDGKLIDSCRADLIPGALCFK